MNAVVPGGTLLYKFRSFATQKEIEFAADILLNHRLFAAAPRSFNDPFDCDAPYCFDATESEKIERAVARIKKESPDVGDGAARQLAPSRYIAAETKGLEQFRSLLENRLGVVSLAESMDNPLLWGHYANCHTGISIEFRPSDLRHADFFGNVLPVTYQKERPVVNFYLDELTEQVRKCVLTKSVDWAYEREWRIIWRDRQNQPYVYFDPSLVGAIYLGCQIDDAKRDLVREWLSTRRAIAVPRLFQARKSETTYELVFEEILTNKAT
jgi:hypothetical protein